MKLAICNETYQGWGWSEACRKTSELGYQGIEIAPYTLADDVRSLNQRARLHLRRCAEQVGLEVVGLHWLLVSPKGLSLTTADKEKRETTGEYMLSLVDFCYDLGGHIMVLGSPNQRRLSEASSRKEAVERLIQAIRPALDRALSCDITFCLEPLPGPEADFINTLDEALEVIQIAQHPALKTILDVKSACSESKSIPELIVQHGPLIAHCHANDANRRGPGFGDTDFVPIMQALESIHYAGFVSVEVFDYSPDPETIARESLLTLCHSLVSAGGSAMIGGAAKSTGGEKYV